MSVLRSLSASRCTTGAAAGPVAGQPTLRFLLRDPDFPRSVAHCLAEVERPWRPGCPAPTAGRRRRPPRHGARWSAVAERAAGRACTTGSTSCRGARRRPRRGRGDVLPARRRRAATPTSPTGPVRARRLGPSRPMPADVRARAAPVRPSPGATDPAARPGRPAVDARPGAARLGTASLAARRLGPAELDRRQRAADRLMRGRGRRRRAPRGRRPSALSPGDRRRAALMDAATWAAWPPAWPSGPSCSRPCSPTCSGPAPAARGRRAGRGAGRPRPACCARPGPARHRRRRLTVVGADVVRGRRRARARRACATPPTCPAATATRSWPGPSDRVLPRTRPRAAACVGHRRYTAGAAGGARPRRRRPAGPAPDRGRDRAAREPGYVENTYLATQLGYHLAEAADVAVRAAGPGCGRSRPRAGRRRAPPRPRDRARPRRGRRAPAPASPGWSRPSGSGGVAVVNPHGAGRGRRRRAAALPRRRRPFLWPAAAACRRAHVWCGDPEAAGRAAGRPRPLGPPRRRPADAEPPAVGAELADAEVADVRARIDARPERYVAQEVIALAAGAPPACDRRCCARHGGRAHPGRC